MLRVGLLGVREALGVLRVAFLGVRVALGVLRRRSHREALQQREGVLPRRRGPLEVCLHRELRLGSKRLTEKLQRGSKRLKHMHVLRREFQFSPPRQV